MQEPTGTTESSPLLHNALQVDELRETLKNDARKLTLEDVQDILGKLKQAREEGERELQSSEEQPEEARHTLRQALERLQYGVSEAQKLFDRKHHWRTEVEPNTNLIKAHAAKASNLHRTLRDKRRELRAKDVEALRDELVMLERESMSAWGVVRDCNLPVSLEHRLHKATEAISNALKDANGTLSRKKPWEDLVAANVAAIESELKKLEALVVAACGPLDAEVDPAAPPRPPIKTPELTRAFKRVEDLLRSRRPLEKECVARLSGELSKLFAHSQGKPAEEGQAKAAEPPRRASREEVRAARTEVESALAQAEAALGLTWVPRKRKGDEAPADATVPPAQSDSPVEVLQTGGDGHHDTSALEAELDAALAQSALAGASDGDAGDDEHLATESDVIRLPLHSTAEEGELEGGELEGGPTPLREASANEGTEDAGHDPDAHGSDAHGSDAQSRAQDAEHGTHVQSTLAGNEPLKMGAIKVIQGHLSRAREILDTTVIPGAERKALWARFRNASDTLRRVRSQSRLAELDELKKAIEGIQVQAREGNPGQARKAIQEIQKQVVESPLTRAERDVLLSSLREAWNTTSAHQEELKEQRRQKEAADLARLGEHFMRWKHRREGITSLVSRLESQLDEIQERKRTTTSIGYKVLAEQRLHETKERISELKGVLEDLVQKIVDVGPRLQAAGWVEPPPSERPAPPPGEQGERGGRRDGPPRDGHGRDSYGRDGRGGRDGGGRDGGGRDAGGRDAGGRGDRRGPPPGDRPAERQGDGARQGRRGPPGESLGDSRDSRPPRREGEPTK